jgi:hypothetical protein
VLSPVSENWELAQPTVPSDATTEAVELLETIGVFQASVRGWNSQAFRKFKAKALCANCHGLQTALDVTADGLAVLACGCTRPRVLPGKAGRVGPSELAAFSTNAALAKQLWPVDTAYTVTQRYAAEQLINASVEAR